MISENGLKIMWYANKIWKSVSNCAVLIVSGNDLAPFCAGASAGTVMTKLRDYYRCGTSTWRVSLTMAMISKIHEPISPEFKQYRMSLKVHQWTTDTSCINTIRCIARTCSYALTVQSEIIKLSQCNSRYAFRSTVKQCYQISTYSGTLLYRHL